MPLENADKSRRLMHRRSIECDGFLRDDGLWEVEAWLRDTKPFSQSASRFRDELAPGDPVHDIGLRLAIDDTMTIREAEAMMRGTPYPTCIDVEPILGRLVGERIGPGWREIVRRKIGRLETCTHLMELLGPAVTTLFQTMSHGEKPEGRDFAGEPAAARQAAVLHRRLPLLAHRRPGRSRDVPAVRDQAGGEGLGAGYRSIRDMRPSNSPLGCSSRLDKLITCNCIGSDIILCAIA